MIIITDAINSLRPGAQWHLIGLEYEGLNWLDETQSKPTEEEIESELKRLQDEYDNEEYQRLRRLEYPSFEKQLDIIFHSGVEEWKKVIQQVKDKYPKG